MRLHCLRGRLRRRPRGSHLSGGRGLDCQGLAQAVLSAASRRVGIGLHRRRCSRPASRSTLLDLGQLVSRDDGELEVVARAASRYSSFVIGNRSMQSVRPHSHTIVEGRRAPRSSWSFSICSLTSRKSASFMPIRSRVVAGLLAIVLPFSRRRSPLDGSPKDAISAFDARVIPRRVLEPDPASSRPALELLARRARVDGCRGAKTDICPAAQACRYRCAAMLLLG